MPRSTCSQLMTGSKKHKRGARGSTEEDPNTCKRANMAATEDIQDQEFTTEEPAITATEITATETSLEELKEMLVDIQINIANIFRENKSIRNELAELTTTVREQKLEIAHLKTSLTKITKQCADAEYELGAARKRVNEQQDEIYELYDLQDRLEQYTRKNSLEIHGVPESAYSTTEEVVLKLAEALEVSIAPQDIEISHKLKRKGNKPIIVKFVSHKVKSNIYKSRTKLKNIKVSNLFPGANAATRAAGDRIFLHENLTSYRKKIVNRANEKRRDGVLLSVWTLDGKIYVKTSPEGRPIKINDLEDLENL